MRKLTTFLYLIAILGQSLAQTPTTPPVEPPAIPAPTTPPPAVTPPAPTVVPTPAPVPKERTVYIPFDDLAKTLANEGQGVFLPYREFLDLWNQLTIQEKKAQVPSPAEAVLSSLDYTGAVTGEVATITATLQVESFKEEGWAVLPLVGKGLNIAKAEPGEATLRLAGTGYELLLPKKGKYTVKLELMARVERNSGRFQLKLTLPKAPVSRCTLNIPEQGWEFRLQPVAAFTTKPTEQGATDLSFFFGESEDIEVTWQKQGGETKLTPLVFAEISQSVNAGAGTVQNKLEIDYRILRAGVDRFTLVVPAPHEVLSVAGENIKEWSPPKTEGDKPRELTVVLHAPARDQFHLTIQLEAPVDALPADVKIPAIEAKEVVRQRGSILLYAPNELDATLKDLAGLNQQEIISQATPPDANANGVAGIVPAGGPSVQASYRYLKLPFAAILSLKRAEPVVEISTATLVQVALDTVRFKNAVNAQVKRSGIFNLRMQVPSDFDAIEAVGAIIDSSKIEDADGKRFLDVRFKSRVTGPLVFEVTGRRNRDSAEQPVLIPVFDPQGVARHEAIVALSLHESLDPNTKDLGGLRQEDVANVQKQLPVEQVAPESHLNPPSLAFRYRGSAAPGTITTRLKQSQVTGDVLTAIALKEQATSYTWRISYDIQYAGVDSFTLSIPKAIAKNLRVDTRDLKEIIKELPVPAPKAPEPNKDKPEAPKQDEPKPEPPPVADRELWKITLRDKRMGAFLLDLSLEVPVKDLTAGQATEVVVPQIILEDVFQEIGQTAITKDGNLEVLDSKVENMENIDPKELRGILSRPGVILSYKNLGHPATLRLSISKNIFLEVPQAIVTYAVLNTVLSSNGASSTEVIYWVKNNTLQYLDVGLPEGGRMLSDVYVNGEPQQPMQRAENANGGKKSESVLIKIPNNDTGAAFPVRFLYEIPAPAELADKDLGFNGALSIAPPVLNLKIGVLQSQVTLFLPRDYVYLNFEGSMRQEPRNAGWSDLHSRLRWLIPVLGADVSVQKDQSWTAPPTLPAENKGGFNLQLPTDGQSFPLHRLDAPAATIITYRSARLDIAVRYMAMLGAFLVGLLLLRRNIEVKSTYFCFVGLGSLVLRGLMSPAWAPLWESVWLGTLLALGLWLIVGIPKLFASTPAPVAATPSVPATPRHVAPVTPVVAAAAATVSPQPEPIPVEPSQLLFREKQDVDAEPLPPIPDPVAPPPPWEDDVSPQPPTPPSEPLPPFPTDQKPE